MMLFENIILMFFRLN